MLLLVLPMLLVACSKDIADNSPTSPTNLANSTYQRTENGFLYVPRFIMSNPEFITDGTTIAFPSIKFESYGIEGFTKIDHNKFQANESKKYLLNMNLSGVLEFDIDGPAFASYILSIKIGDNIVKRIWSRRSGDEPKESLTIELNQDDVISFDVVAARAVTGVGPKTFKNNALEIRFTEL